MNGDILHLIEVIHNEKEIPREALFVALEKALVLAASKQRETKERLEATVDRESGEISLVAIKQVVDVVKNPDLEISLAEARKLDPDIQLNEEIEIPQEITELGRIGAQKVKQMILQLVREAEKEKLFNQYKARTNELVLGMASVVDERAVLVEMKDVDAILPRREMIPGENFVHGETIRAVIHEVKMGPYQPQVILSRCSSEFLKRLFELEVPEIHEGIVEIVKAVREPGARAKICVISHNKNVDPVGACVGVKGSRVQAIVKELRGENIDVIPYSENIEEMVIRALSPAKISKITLHKDKKLVEVLVKDDQLSLAIGRKGQNVRLASKLIDWEIEITSDSRLKAKYEKRKA